MSKPLNNFIEEIRANVKSELLKYVNEFDLKHWVDYVNENPRKFTWGTPYVKVNATIFSANKFGQCVQLSKYYDEDSLSFYPLTKDEFYIEVVELLYSKYF